MLTTALRSIIRASDAIARCADAWTDTADDVGKYYREQVRWMGPFMYPAAPPWNPGEVTCEPGKVEIR